MADDLALALALADVADALALPAFERGEAAVEKADGTPVTEADRAVERALRERLGAERPDDPILREELGGAGNGARRRARARGGGGSPRWTAPSGSRAASRSGAR